MKFKVKGRRFCRIPDVKTLPYKMGLMVFLSLLAIGVLIGATIATYVFFGTITLAGLIAIIESNKYLKFIASKSNKLLDIIIFMGTLYATLSLGVTITASLTFAGLGYTLVYAPWLRLRNNK
ncbi:hypothetical protein H7U19_14960 [Hyunsoonleella sp. SJ7]|uniref:Uncharacterized protein n=1 Tax=Hyunsoonleella aquatilis TaxID=2762758 RepID=A0A923KH48_9FLAO|nr:hypothetical protein [Hyunsoonleella aquatilis]MBC3759711.1 hypothetical protein [Hyunsoonleella aquatilis]